MSLAGVWAGVGSGAVWADDEPMQAPEAAQLTRVDMPNLSTHSAPGYRTDMTELVYRRWVTRGRADVGIGFGSVTLVDRANGVLPGQLVDGQSQPAGSGALLMLGLRYRTTAQSTVYADAAHGRGLGLDGDDHVVGKVGIEFKAVQSNWKIAYGGLGFRLAGDARMTLKLRRSGLAIMMRSTF
jgi:hypothetical protein